MRFAVFYQETGEEGILHPEPGETDAQLLARAPEEWRFRHWDEDYATKRERTMQHLARAHAGDEDYDPEAHMEFLEEQQERYDERWG